MIPIVAGLLALVLGVPRLLHVGCPACAAMMAHGMELHPACCGGSSATAGCCEMKVSESTPGIEAAAAKVAPPTAPLPQAPIAAASVHEALARPVPLAGDPLLYESAGICTLHSVLLI